jgi:hypothetical protein
MAGIMAVLPYIRAWIVTKIYSSDVFAAMELWIRQTLLNMNMPRERVDDNHSPECCFFFNKPGLIVSRNRISACLTVRL